MYFPTFPARCPQMVTSAKFAGVLAATFLLSLLALIPSRSPAYRPSGNVLYEDDKAWEEIKNPNEPMTFSSPSGTEFTLPNKDEEFVKEMEAFNNGGSVDYMRNDGDVAARGEKGACASMMDVLAWIMDEVNAKGETFMVTYDDLLHIHREHDFKREDGTYIEKNDLDAWATFDTVRLLAYLEPELFRRFGWTMRMFDAEGKYVVFAQILASCGHQPSHGPNKVIADEPAIEIYPISVVAEDDGRKDVMIDMWQKSKFSASMIFPVRHVNFISVRTTQILHLQLPNKDYALLECLYGDWRNSHKQVNPAINCWSENYSGAQSAVDENGYLLFSFDD